MQNSFGNPSANQNRSKRVFGHETMSRIVPSSRTDVQFRQGSRQPSAETPWLDSGEARGQLLFLIGEKRIYEQGPPTIRIDSSVGVTKKSPGRGEKRENRRVGLQFWDAAPTCFNEKGFRDFFVHMARMFWVERPPTIRGARLRFSQRKRLKWYKYVAPIWNAFLVFAGLKWWL